MQTSPSSTSHPDQPVRHSYPLAVQDASLSTALSLVIKTLPYALARFGLLFGASVATVLWALLTLLGAGFLGARVPILGWIWVLVGLAVPGYLWGVFLRYGLYLLKAGHIAVLTELVTYGRVSSQGESMFAHGKRVVTERLGEVSAMFALDAIVKGVVIAFHRTLHWVANLLPVPGLGQMVRVVNTIVRASTSYIDETLLSYSLARGDDNRFRSAKDGLIYYAQNAQEVLKTGLYIVVLDAVLSVLAWLVCLVPAGALAWLLPPGGGGQLAVVGLAVLVGLNLRAAFFKPLFLVMVMIKFHVAVRNQPIQLEWDARLSEISKGFVQLKNSSLASASALIPGQRPAVAPAS